MAFATSIPVRHKFSAWRRLQLTLVCMSYCVHAMASAQRSDVLPPPAQAINGDTAPKAAAADLIMRHPNLICCKIYISESRNASAIAKIDQAARSKPGDVVVLSKFGDYFYNRVRYTLVSYVNKTGENPMKAVVSEMIKAAIENIDIRQHSGAHPRIGVIDDLSFHPLGDTEMGDAAKLADEVATYIGDQNVSVFLYDEAHPKKKKVREIRSGFGYYEQLESCTEISWNSTEMTERYIQMVTIPDKGAPVRLPAGFHKSGATTVGAAPFLEGYNVPVRSENYTKVKDIVRKLKKQLGGGNEGLPKVLAIAMGHGKGIVEVACLLDPNHVSANEVQDKVRQIAEELGIGDKVEKGYYTDITKDMILVNLAVRHQPSCCPVGLAGN